MNLVICHFVGGRAARGGGEGLSKLCRTITHTVTLTAPARGQPGSWLVWTLQEDSLVSGGTLHVVTDRSGAETRGESGRGAWYSCLTTAAWSRLREAWQVTSMVNDVIIYNVLGPIHLSKSFCIEEKGFITVHVKLLRSVELLQWFP